MRGQERGWGRVGKSERRLQSLGCRPVRCEPGVKRKRMMEAKTSDKQVYIWMDKVTLRKCGVGLSAAWPRIPMVRVVLLDVADTSVSHSQLRRVLVIEWSCWCPEGIFSAGLGLLIGWMNAMAGVSIGCGQRERRRVSLLVPRVRGSLS